MSEKRIENPRRCRRNAPRHGHRMLRIMAAVLCIVCIATGGILTARSSLEEHAYRAAADRAMNSADDAQAWYADIPGAVAWLDVADTDISYPVMQATTTQPADFYLTHDAWGAPSAAGCPYLDIRCEVDGPHLLVYGHATGSPARMFGAIRTAYQQTVFESLGVATWHPTPAAESGADAAKSKDETSEDGGIPEEPEDTLEPTVFQPLCALRVDRSFAAIQRFTLNAGADVPLFARELAEQATARTPDWYEQAARARRILTLVTCSELLPGTHARTLVIFTSS